MSEIRYKIEKAGRHLVLELYAVHDDCGPYCLSWDRIKAKDVSSVKRQLRGRGIEELDTRDQ